MSKYKIKYSRTNGLKIIRRIKSSGKKLFKSQIENHHNILVLGRSGVGKSALINVVLGLKGEKAAKENAVKPETGTDNSLSQISKDTSLIEVEKKSSYL